MAALYECKTSEDVFVLLDPLLSGLPSDVKSILESELVNHAINGESLIFFDNTYLQEMNI